MTHPLAFIAATWLACALYPARPWAAGVCVVCLIVMLAVEHRRRA